MRKELLVYVPTTEKGEEISVTSVSKDRDFVLINANGNKFTANRKELLDALESIEAFDKEHNGNLVEGSSATIHVLKDTYIDAEYTEEE